MNEPSIVLYLGTVWSHDDAIGYMLGKISFSIHVSSYALWGKGYSQWCY